MTAQQLNVEEELVKALSEAYWKKIRKAMSSLEYGSIFVTGLGTFKLKHWKLRELEKELENKLKATNPMVFHAFEAKMKIEKELARVKELIVIFDKQEQDKQEFRKKKKDVRIKRNMEKQETNLLGNMEHNKQEGAHREDSPQKTGNM